MVKHVKMVHEKLRPWTCEECNKSFSDRRDLIAHEDSIHKGLKPFDCPYCDYKCARKKNMYVHIKNIHGDKGSHHGKPSYECGQCGHVAKHRRLLEQHIRSVHEITVKEFQCGLCDFKAATKMSVDRHMQSHTKERRSLTAGECSMCGESFTNAAKLVSHMRTIHGTIDKVKFGSKCVSDETWTRVLFFLVFHRNLFNCTNYHFLPFFSFNQYLQKIMLHTFRFRLINASPVNIAEPLTRH